MPVTIEGEEYYTNSEVSGAQEWAKHQTNGPRMPESKLTPINC